MTAIKLELFMRGWAREGSLSFTVAPPLTRRFPALQSGEGERGRKREKGREDGRKIEGEGESVIHQPALSSGTYGYGC